MGASCESKAGVKSSCCEVFYRCIAACEHCTTCQDHGLEHLQACRDCADICDLYVRLKGRKSKFADRFAKTVAEICEECSKECGKHEDELCKNCVDACKKCIQECKPSCGCH